MTDAAAPGAPSAPPAAAPPPPPSPPPSPPPLATLTEKASQLAGSISSQPQFEAALAQVPGGSTLAPQDKGKLWDTVQKTRVGQGLPPMTIAAPGAPPGGAPVVGGQTPVPPAVTASLPVSVTGAPPQASPPSSAPPAAKPPPGPANVLAQAPPPEPTAASLGLTAPQDAGPVGPDGKPMAAPQERTSTFTPAKYEPPKKGLLYAAAALALLFPGSQIGRAAGAFAQGLNTGADQKYQRDEKTAEQTFQADKANAQTDYQNAISKYGAASEQSHRAFLNLQVANGAKLDQAESAWKQQVAALQQKQGLYVQGLGPDGKPIPPPPALARPLPPNAGAADYAAHESALADWYNTNGMTGPGAQHAASATEYQKQVSAEATQNAELNRTIMTLQASADRTNATINAAAARQEGEFRNQWAMLGAREADQYRDQAVRSNGEASKLWSSLTTPVTDQYGQTKPPIVAPGSPLFQSLNGAMAQMQKGQGRMDPQGYAQYVIDNTPSLKDNPIAAQVLQAKAQGLEFTMRSNGYQPVPFIAPPIAPQHPPSALSFAQDALSHQVPLANIQQAMKDQHYSPGEIATTLKTLQHVSPASAAPVDRAHPDAPLLGVASGIQHVIQTSGAPQNHEAAARAAGLTPGSPAWNNYMRTHGQ
jgi:hypothetical protein